MTNDNKFYIPKYIDEPARIIFFSIDEFVIILAIAGLSTVVGHEVIGIAVATVVYFAYTHFKGKEGSAFLQRYIYWRIGFGPRHFIPLAKAKKYKG